MDEAYCKTYDQEEVIMAKFWLDNDLTDRLAMLEQATDAHVGMVQLAVEKDWWVMVTLKALFGCECDACGGSGW